jgi:hypothetical protein
MNWPKPTTLRGATGTSRSVGGTIEAMRVSMFDAGALSRLAAISPTPFAATPASRFAATFSSCFAAAPSHSIDASPLRGDARVSFLPNSRVRSSA